MATMDDGVEVVHPPAQGIARCGRHQEQILPWSLLQSVALWTPWLQHSDFRLLASRTVGG